MIDLNRCCEYLVVVFWLTQTIADYDRSKSPLTCRLFNMYFYTTLYLSWISVVLATTIADPSLTINGIPFSARAHWMRLANTALEELSGSPCPFSAFGTVIVNHTGSNGPGDLVCMGVNQNSQTGDPSAHGRLLKGL